MQLFGELRRLERVSRSAAHEHAELLRKQRAELVTIRDRVDARIREIEPMIMLAEAQATGDPSRPATRTPSGRMTSVEALHRRAASGATIWAFLNSHAPRRFTRGELDGQFDPLVATMFARVISEWNQKHHDTPILHDSGGKRFRRYYVAKK
jgi:hypothetical protein